MNLDFAPKTDMDTSTVVWAKINPNKFESNMLSDIAGVYVIRHPPFGVDFYSKNHVSSQKHQISLLRFDASQELQIGFF